MSVLIRRSDAIAIIQNADYKYPTWPHIVEAKEGMVQAIKSAHNIDAVPVVRGEWSNEIGDVHSAGKYRVCSACGKNAFILWSSTLCLHGVDYNYCPNCGADMRRESEAKE